VTHFYVLLLALGIGVIAGLRSFTAPAVVAPRLCTTVWAPATSSETGAARDPVAPIGPVNVSNCRKEPRYVPLSPSRPS